MPPTESKGSPAPTGGAALKEPPRPSSALPQEAERAAPKAGNGSRVDSPDRAAAPRPLPAPVVASTLKPKQNKAAPGKGAAPAPAKRESASRAASPAKDSPVDVALNLSVKDRGAAERDLTTLLVRLGGTKLGRSQGSSTIMVIVPQSKYHDFTRGLTRIGAWHMEAGRSSLPDPVRLAVRLTP